MRHPCFQRLSAGALLCACLLLAGCGSEGPAGSAPGVNQDSLENLSYLYEEGDGPIRLRNGLYEGPALRSGGSLGLRVELAQTAFGDLDGDGARDGAAVLNVEPGTGQSYRYLMAVLDRGGQATPVSSVFLEDRLVVRELRIDDGEVVMDVLSHELDDPLGQPSLAETWRFALDGDVLLER